MCILRLDHTNSMHFYFYLLEYFLLEARHHAPKRPQLPQVERPHKEDVYQCSSNHPVEDATAGQPPS